MKLDRRQLLAAAAGAPAAAFAGETRPSAAGPRRLTTRPPMGWNSWNSFGTTIDEAQVRANAEILARRLLPSGYDTLTVDIQWYESKVKGYEYTNDPAPALDEHGRLLPAPGRFPSSAGGRGFAPLAAYVHSLGLKFGVHLMRGIPRLAVERKLPVLGTDRTAAQIADRRSTCPWNPDMFGVDMRQPAAQAYYDSVFALFAQWGVDFVKMDDMSRPYDAHAAEIEAASRAIRKSGRPIVLSLSPGETPPARADHVARHADMWRISDDFWDEWPQLHAQFARLETWSGLRRPGAWPDADMLPLGRLALGERSTRLTADEQRTLMTLWGIARSPLIMGGDLRHLDDATFALLTQADVLRVNQQGRDNRPHFVADGWHLWTARTADGTAYVAAFNTGDQPGRLEVDAATLGLPGGRRAHDVWAAQDLGPVGARLALQAAAHGVQFLRLAA